MAAIAPHRASGIAESPCVLWLEIMRRDSQRVAIAGVRAQAVHPSCRSGFRDSDTLRFVFEQVLERCVRSRTTDAASGRDVRSSS
jgi:hypothetical protein